MDGLAHTSRGVLGSAVLLLIVGGVVVYSLNEAKPPEPESAPPAIPAHFTSLDDERVRVALTRRAVSTVRLKIEGSYHVTSSDEHRPSLDRTESLAEDNVTAAPGGIRFCGRIWDSLGIEITPSSSPGIWVNGRKYRGSLRLFRTGSSLRAVNVLPLEEYVAAVVDAEMPADFPVAAREAQAIAARTYALSCRLDPANELFDLYATPVSQNYLGVIYEGSDGRLLAGETAGGRAAAAATAHVICTFDRQPFRAYYSACCGGRTFFGGDLFDDADSLHSVTCGGCEDAPLYRWQRSIAEESAMRRLAQLARARVPAFRSIISAKTIGDAKTPAVVELSDGVRRVRLPAVEVRRAIELPSLCFDLTADRQQIKVTGRGHGHGVGLCQWGAKGLAERGLTGAQILQHYYPGCALSHLTSAASPRIAEAGGRRPAGDSRDVTR
jgi:stage II sporulation protein D